MCLHDQTFQLYTCIVIFCENCLMFSRVLWNLSFHRSLIWTGQSKKLCAELFSCSLFLLSLLYWSEQGLTQSCRCSRVHLSMQDVFRELTLWPYRELDSFCHVRFLPWNSQVQSQEILLWVFSLIFLSIFRHISGSSELITFTCISLERSFPPAELEYGLCQFWFKGDDVRSGTKANGCLAGYIVLG